MFGPLHKINPLRVGWIDEIAGGVAGKRIVDVGCGGGILSEALAARGRRGRRHRPRRKGAGRREAASARVRIERRLPARRGRGACGRDARRIRRRRVHGAARARARSGVDHRCLCRAREAGRHRRDLDDQPQSQGVCARDLGAEYLLQMLPRGTHDYAKFLHACGSRAPSRGAPASSQPASSGSTYNPFAKTFRLSPDTDVNYMMAFRRPADG